jgi:two-component system, chemotaxis family, response regulator Rcp1
MPEPPEAISCHLTILPNKDGRKVLAEIKADEDLRHIPVVMGTVSSAEEDILKTYNLHANCYITKPIDLDQSIKAARSMSARS